MRKEKRTRRFGSILVTVLLLAALVPQGSAQEAQKTIRVAFPTQEGMSFFGHAGKVTGYNYDYLEKISEYTGWEMEYVPSPWSRACRSRLKPTTTRVSSSATIPEPA